MGSSLWETQLRCRPLAGPFFPPGPGTPAEANHQLRRSPGGWAGEGPGVGRGDTACRVSGLAGWGTHNGLEGEKKLEISAIKWVSCILDENLYANKRFFFNSPLCAGDDKLCPTPSPASYRAADPKRGPQVCAPLSDHPPYRLTLARSPPVLGGFSSREG